jgi:hypothetical protein
MRNPDPVRVPPAFLATAAFDFEPCNAIWWRSNLSGKEYKGIVDFRSRPL